MVNEPFRLASETVGALPVVNRFLDRLRVEQIFSRHIPKAGRDLSYMDSLLVMLRNIVMSRAPVYGLDEWAAPFRPSLLGLTPQQLGKLNDDRLGRALDRLFDADRASMLTEVVVQAIREFDLDMDVFHNDSTSITFSGQYEDADGEAKRGKPSLNITNGHNKEHRPDLKQLLWILTVTADGAVPVHYRVCDGNTTDSPTHQETWDAIRALAGRPDFIYVADCKLCTKGNTAYIASQEGKFITILPKNRKEHEWFRTHVQTNSPSWEEVASPPDPSDKNGPPHVWRMVESPMPSADGFRIVWVWSSQKAELDMKTREAMMECAFLGIERLETRLQSPRTRMRTHEAIVGAAERAIGKVADRWVSYEISEEEIPIYKQEGRGRPGKNTRYERTIRIRYHVTCSPKKESIEFDANCDGMFPLITNCADLPMSEILATYKYQPRLEKRHEQLKTVHEVAPVLLKSVTRIEALLFLFFLALLVEALIEREVRLAMKREGIESLPLYHEERECRSPTTDRLLSVLENIQVHHLYDGETLVQSFFPKLTSIQKEVLRMTGTSSEDYAC